MQIKFYHWWVYKLFYLVWNPIFLARPDLHKKFIELGITHILNREEEILERRNEIRIVE
jgi:hypothetical protein